MSIAGFEFQEDVEVDAQLMFLAETTSDDEAGMKEFREKGELLIQGDPLKGIARGLWLKVQSNDYKLRVRARLIELFKENGKPVPGAQVVS